MDRFASFIEFNIDSGRTKKHKKAGKFGVKPLVWE